ncbi:NADP oxidoreductase coenzyme F420-dependent [Candidatus Fervidibacteria bacterium JGI MDM2 JNZ-1-D12]
MLTIFACPKPFTNPHIAIIQRNAITSWTLLRPKPEIILFGDEEGVAEICQELGLRHVPEVARNEYGAPLVSDLFKKAQQLAAYDLLCYVNADIILMGDFMEAVQRVQALKQKFLMVGRVWRVYIDTLWEFTSDWEQQLRDYVLRHGAQAPPPGNSDFFAFSRGLWTSIPPLAIGRGWWDPWLIYEARRLRALVIDVSWAVMAVHQNHDQSAYPHGLRRWREEINRNYELVGKEASRFCLLDATHLLTPSGLKRPFGIRYLVRSVDTLPLFHPALALPMGVPRMLIKAMRALRERRQQARDPLYRLFRLVLSNLPKNGITSILGLASQPDADVSDGSKGLSLARLLLGGGYPVIVYDPEPTVMAQARRALGGPVEFATSVEECVKEGDVIVLAAPRDEFKRLPVKTLVRENSPRVLIDCCQFLKPEQFEGIVRYVSWR